MPSSNHGSVARRALRRTGAFIAACLACLASIAFADPAWQTQVVDELSAQIRIDLPAGVEDGGMHATERALHRGVPGNKTYHVLLQLSDANSGRRRADVREVWATLLAGDEFRRPIQLRPMQDGGDVGFGNYMDFGPAGPYVMRVEIWLEGRDRASTVEFRFAQIE